MVVLRQWRSKVSACPVHDSHLYVIGMKERDLLRDWPAGCAG